MSREIMFGIFYAAIFGLAAFVVTILGVAALKSPEVSLVHAWVATADAHAVLLVIANIAGWVYGCRAAERPVAH